jgi:short-subunit dehydrogenase
MVINGIKMKIAITGHTKGIGAALFKKLENEKCEVIGYSRSNGWDLTNEDTREKFYEDIKLNNFDVFINNAYPYDKFNTIFGFLQVELLNKVWSIWNNQSNKIIVTIGSQSSEIVKNYYHPYSIHKKAIDDTCKQLRACSEWPLIMNIKPGYVDTDIVKKINKKKCSPLDVAEIIWFSINHKLNIYDIHFGAR